MIRDNQPQFIFSLSALMRWIQVKVIISYWVLIILSANEAMWRKEAKEQGIKNEKHWDDWDMDAADSGWTLFW